jgi:hypothetical protein
MFAVRDVVLYSLVAGVLAAGVVAVWPWARQRGIFAIAGLTTTLGMMAWNSVLHITNTASLNVDAPVIGLSWQDAGSGVCACVATALVLGLWTLRAEPARRVVGVAAIAGVVAMVFDIFVL